MEGNQPEPYRIRLPALWLRLDRQIVRATELAVFFVGSAFTVLITLEVVSRYIFDFSIFFINAAARFLLVWFFLLGAGLAFRQGAHVGFELFIRLLPWPIQRALFVIVQLLTLVFFLEILWSGSRALAPALRQIEGSLGISVFWAMLAFPVGFVLLMYHQLVMFYSALTTRQTGAAGS